MAVHPMTSSLYISLPLKRKILRLSGNSTLSRSAHHLNQLEPAVGTGETCVDSDKRCGDGGAASSAKLAFPKGKKLQKTTGGMSLFFVLDPLVH